MSDIKVLHEEVIYANGCFRRVRRYLKGIHPELGKIHKGWSGWETIQETDSIKPLHTVYINPQIISVRSFPLDSAYSS